MIYLEDILSRDKVDRWGLNTDYGVRDYAFMYIDNNLYKGSVHKDILEEYIQNNSLNMSIDKTNGYITEEEKEDLDLPLVIGSVLTDKNNQKYVIIYDTCFYGWSIDSIISQIKEDFKNHIICIDPLDRRIEHTKPYLELVA